MTNLTVACALIIAVFASPAPARGESVGLPLEINDSNTTVTFSVDSTWHLVHGKTSGIEGRVSLADPNSLNSVTGEVSLPVRNFDTDNTKRDTRLREVMAEQNHPRVRFLINGASVQCPDHSTGSNYTCQARIFGTLNIREINKPWALSGKLMVNSSGQYEIESSAHLRWADFGVEDPSIIIARLADEVSVLVRVQWRDEHAEHSQH